MSTASAKPNANRDTVRDRMTEGSVVFAYKYRTADFDMELVVVRVTAIATQSQMSLLTSTQIDGTPISGLALRKPNPEKDVEPALHGVGPAT